MSETPHEPSKEWQPYNPQQDPELLAIAQTDVHHFELITRLGAARDRLERISQGEQPGDMQEARELKEEAQIELDAYRAEIGFYPEPPAEDQP